MSIKVPEGLPKSRADQIRAVFNPMTDMLDKFEELFNKVVAEKQSPERCKNAKRLRLDISKIRTNADKVRKEQKKEFLVAGNFIQAIYNILDGAVSSKEKELKDIELYYERIEEEKIAKIEQDRIFELEKYSDDPVIPRDLGKMDQDVWDKYINGIQREHEARIAAEEQAEQERIEKERKEKVYRERKDEIAKYAKFGSLELLQIDMDEDKYNDLLSLMQAAKKDDDKRQAKIEADKERLEIELKQQKAERERIEKENDIKLQKLREEAQKQEDEREKKLEAERAEHRRIGAEKNAKLAKLESEKRQAATDQAEQLRREVEAKRQADNAPDKEKLQKLAKYRESKIDGFTTAAGESAVLSIIKLVERFIDEL